MGANAQTSVPAFTAGQVLTAAQVTQINTGIPVFASSTERDAAFGGTGEKTLAEGQMAYLEDTDETQYYDGTSWGPVSAGGLTLVSRTTIGSAVSTVTVSNAFSADYDNYKILISGGVASAEGYLKLTFGATTSGYKYQFMYGAYAGSGIFTGSSAAAGNLYAGTSTTFGIFANIDLNSPFLTGRTGYQNTIIVGSAAGYVVGYLDDATSYTAFTLAPNTGTMTGGNIDVYGYAKG